MFKPLLRVLPALSGNVTIDCVLNEFEALEDNEFSCYARSAKLLPISSNLFKRNMHISLLNSSYEWDLYRFYRFYSNYFWKSWFAFDTNDLPKFDKYNSNPNRDLDFEFGCKRLQYQEFNKQFSFFAPIYLESVEDIPECFEIEINLIAAKTYRVKKVIRVNLGNSPTPNNYLYNYIYNYASKLDDNVLFFKVEDKECIYHGIDLMHGGFIKATDNIVSKLFLRQNTINNFDNVICKGFERNNIALKQVLPLSFSFNVNDLLSETEKEKYRNAEMHITGKWVKNGFFVELYDWSYDYTRFFQRVKKINNQTGLLDFVYPKNKVKTSASVGVPTRVTSASIGVLADKAVINGTTIIPVKRNSASIGVGKVSGSIGVDSPKSKTDFSDYLNVMDMGSPSLREARFKKYKYSNKISPNYSRWKLKYSDDNNPYITNFSPAFSQINNGLYGEYPQQYADITGIVRKQYNAYYNLVLPIGETGREIYKDINLGLYDRYTNTVNRFCSAWFETLNFNKENPVESEILNNPAFKDVKDNRCFYNGVLYNFENIYDTYKGAEKIDKFGVFITLNFKPVNPATIEDQFFTNYVIYKDGGKYVRVPNTFILDNVLNDKDTFLFKDISTGYLTDELDQHVSFIQNEYNMGDFFNMIDCGLDYYEINKFYKWQDLIPYVNYSEYFNMEDFLVSKFEKLPIYKASNLINKDNNKVNISFSNITDMYYSVMYNSNINKITTNSKINLIESPHTKNSIAIYQENTFISSYNLHDLVEKNELTTKIPLSDIENTLNKYIWNPSIKDSDGETEVTTNCFEKLSGKLSKFYGNEIPEKFKNVDNDVLYLDPYNYNNIVRHYNSTWLKYKQDKLHLIDAGNDPFERIEHFGKFLNMAHLLYYIKFIYDDPDASNTRKWFSYENIYLRKRVFKYNYNTEEDIDIDDIYIPFSEYFIIKENMTNNEFNDLFESIANTFVYDETANTFRFNKIKTFNNKYVKFNYNEATHGPIVPEYLIDENAIDYYTNIQKTRTSLSSEVDGKKFLFDLCFKKEFIKVNKEIFRLINIEENFYGAPYKDLYIYEFERKEDFNQNYYIFEQKDDEYRKWKSNSLECLKPLFFNIFLEEKENTKIFAEYNLYNIFPVHVIDDNRNVIDTFYRRNTNNVLCMMDLTQFSKLKTYVLNENNDDSFVKIGDKYYMYEPAYHYYNDLGYITSDAYTYFPRTFDKFTNNHTIVENAHYIESYLYISDYSDTYTYIDKTTVKYYNQHAYNTFVSSGGMLPENNVTKESVKVIDPVTLTDVYRVTTTKAFPVIDLREPIYAYGYTYTYFDDLGLYNDFGLSSYKHVDAENGKVTNYAFININNTFNNTAAALNLLEETGEHVKYVSYINNQNIIENKDYIYNIYKQIVPFIRNNALETLNNNFKHIISMPKRLLLSKDYSFKSPDDIIFNNTKDVKKFYLDRYFDNVVPLILETNSIQNAYMVKYKDTEKSFNPNKSETIYNDELSLVNYPGIKVYNLENKNQNSYTVVYENEWKHFNSNKYYNLNEYFEIDVPKMLTFEELVYYQGYDMTLEYFKNYCMTSINCDFDDDQILFLFNRYDVQYNSVCEKLTDDLENKLYKLKYRFKLK
jgi:hypothetical protein